MKNIIYLFIGLAVLASCEKVIDINLNEAAPQMVIEGLITNEPGPYYVNVSQTTDFFNPGEIPQIEGAMVIVSDNIGTIDTLKEIQPGVYETQKIVGTQGVTYTLSVTHDEITCTATTTMPFLIPIDSLTVKTYDFGKGAGGPGGPPDGKFYSVAMHFNDSLGISNYYRLKTYLNNRELRNIGVFDDKFFDGQSFNTEQIEWGFRPDSNVTMELWNIDFGVYDYYKTLAEVLEQNPMSSSAPANPNSNISHGGLGYFAAISRSIDSIKITK